MKKGLFLTVLLLNVTVMGFAQSALSGTYRFSANSYITFNGNSFTGSWSRTATMSGTYSVSGSRLTLNITGGTQARNTWNWTIVDANTLRDQDGDRWNKEGSADGRAGWEYFSSAYEAQNRGDFDQAIADFTQAIRLEPSMGYLYYVSRGEAYMQKGDYDRAIADCTEAIRLQSENVWAFKSRGEAYMKKRDYDRAIADFNQAIRLSPDYASAYNNRGLAYEQKSNWTLALEDFITALRLDSGNDTNAGENLERILAAVPSLAGANVLWTVNNAASWIEAVNGIRSGGNNKVHTITISGNFSIPMSNESTFGSVASVVVRLGGGGTISPSSSGNLLRVGAGQTVVAKDLTLRGRNENNGPVVRIENGGTFRMEGNATVTGNTARDDSYGGVYVNGGTFVLLDSASVTGNNARVVGGVYISSGGLFYMRDNASVSGNFNDSRVTIVTSGGVYVSGGDFYMSGNASVSGNTGGGVYFSGKTFQMSGNASVSGNTSSNTYSSYSDSGGVYVSGGNFEMLGNASVSGNTGGGVYFSGSNFGMYVNASITGNTGWNAGGVYVPSGNFYMTGNASVSDNTSSGNGGGVNVSSHSYSSIGSFTMYGGTISGNTGREGGGVYSSGTFTMQGGTISGNTANESGGGVYSVRTFTMQGGTISGNTTNESGGGVYLGNGTFTKTGGTINGNDADQELRNNLTSRNGRGNAVYDYRNSRWRNAGVGPTVNPETYGFWLND